MLHAAAWTNVDGAEDDPQEAAAVNVGGSSTSPSSAFRSSPTRATTSSTGEAEPYVESDAPDPLGAYGRTKLHGEAAAGTEAWIVRSSWLFGPTGHNFVRTMLRLGAERDEVAVVDDSGAAPTYIGHLAEATAPWSSCRSASTTSPPRATAPGPSSRRRSSRRPGSCRVRRITSAEFGAKAPRPAYSVLRSEKGAPELPHWRDGLRECLALLAA